MKMGFVIKCVYTCHKWYEWLNSSQCWHDGSTSWCIGMADRVKSSELHFVGGDIYKLMIVENKKKVNKHKKYIKYL